MSEVWSVDLVLELAVNGCLILLSTHELQLYSDTDPRSQISNSTLRPTLGIIILTKQPFTIYIMGLFGFCRSFSRDRRRERSLSRDRNHKPSRSFSRSRRYWDILSNLVCPSRYCCCIDSLVNNSARFNFRLFVSFPTAALVPLTESRQRSVRCKASWRWTVVGPFHMMDFNMANMVIFVLEFLNNHTF